MTDGGNQIQEELEDNHVSESPAVNADEAIPSEQTQDVAETQCVVEKRRVKFLWPIWVKHGQQSQISSVSISADGTRVCTGGCDMLAKVWSLAAVSAKSEVLDVSDEESLDEQAMKEIPLERYGRVLGFMQHSSTVSCVRYRPGSSDVIATSSDDGYVNIWQRELFSPIPTVKVFGFDGAYHENYRMVIHSSKVHKSDVPDLAWSPDGTKLASCSIDNTICVFNAMEKGSDCLMKSITDAMGPVKGLAWDPLDRFLVAQTEDEDRSILVFETRDFSLVRTIKDCCPPGEELFFRRPDWNPDASVFTCVAGKDNCTVDYDRMQKVVSSSDKFSGTPIVVRYGRPFTGKSSGKDENVVFPVAVATKDGSLYIASSAGTTLLVAKKTFKQPPTDMAWSPDGNTLLVTSSEGIMIGVELDLAKSLGTLCTKAAFDKHLQRMYGEMLTVRPPTGLKDIAESANQFLFEQQHEAKKAAERRTATKAVSSRQKQTETIVKGRRRITPVTVTFEDFTMASSVSSLQDSAAVAVPEANPTSSISTSTSEKESNLEKRFTGPRTVESSSKPTGSSPAAQESSSDGKSTASPSKPAEDDAGEDIVYPQFDSTPAPSSTKSASTSSSKSTHSSTITPSASAMKRISAPPESSSKRSRSTSSGLHSGFDHRFSAHEHNSGSSSSRNNSASVGSSRNSLRRINSFSSSSVPLIPVANPLSSPPSSDSLQFVVSMDCGIIRTVSAKSIADAIVLSLKEDGNTSSIVWSVSVPHSKATHLIGNADICVLLCVDSSMHVFSTHSGRYILPRIWLGAPAVRVALCQTAPIVALVTTTRELSIYDFGSKRAIASRVPISDTLLSKSSLSQDASFVVSSGGVARFATSSETVAFSPQMSAWLSIARAAAPGIVSASAPALSVTECEQSLALAEIMDSQAEYELALLSYVQALVSSDDSMRIRDLFETLRLKLSDKQPSAGTPAGSFCSKALFKRALAIASTNRSLQRLVDEFCTALQDPAQSAHSAASSSSFLLEAANRLS